MKKRKLIVCIYSILIITILVSCKQVIFDGSDAPLPTTPVTKTPTVAADKNPQQKPEDEQKTEQTVTKAPEQIGTGDLPSADLITPTEVPTVTEAPAVELSPTNSPTPTATPVPPTPTQGPITAEKAKNLLLGEIGTEYEAEYDGETKAAGDMYYLFTVSDSAHVYTPQIAVNANSKEIFYYYSQDEIAEFANFPPDNLENAGGEEGEDSENEFTSRDAIELLNKLTPMELGLPAELSAYTILVDEWTTMVYGLECYCVNAYAELENRKQLMGVYFVALDGSVAYRSDMGDFVLIY